MNLIKSGMKESYKHLRAQLYFLNYVLFHYKCFQLNLKLTLNACSWSCVWFISALYSKQNIHQEYNNFLHIWNDFLFLADDQFQSLFYLQKRMEEIMLKRYYSNRKWKLHYWKSIFHMSVINPHVEVKWHHMISCGADYTFPFKP